MSEDKVMVAEEEEMKYNLFNHIEKIGSIEPTDIKILRLKAGLDQRTLAQGAQMSNNTISRLENGLTSLAGLPFEKVIKLLNMLNIDNNVYKYLHEGEMN